MGSARSRPGHPPPPFKGFVDAVPAKRQWSVPLQELVLTVFCPCVAAGKIHEYTSNDFWTGFFCECCLPICLRYSEDQELARMGDFGEKDRSWLRSLAKACCCASCALLQQRVEVELATAEANVPLEIRTLPNTTGTWRYSLEDILKVNFCCCVAEGELGHFAGPLDFWSTCLLYSLLPFALMCLCSGPMSCCVCAVFGATNGQNMAARYDIEEPVLEGSLKATCCCTSYLHQRYIQMKTDPQSIALACTSAPGQEKMYGGAWA